MLDFNRVANEIQTFAFPNIQPQYLPETEKIMSDIWQRLIYICGHNFFYFEDKNIIFDSVCVTWRNGFWCESESHKTPTWLHYIQEFIWDGCDKYQSFQAGYPSVIETPVQDGEIKSWMYSRILTLNGVEETNKNTLSRYVYIHGNINHWYWKTDNLQRSFWCIWLQLDDMVYFFDLIKKYREKIFVYINENT